MREKTYTKIFRKKNNNFDAKIDFLLNLSLENVVVVFYIEQMDRLFLKNLEDAEIICEDMYFVAVKIEKAEDIKKISKVLFEGNFRFTGFLMINNKEKLKEICLKCMDIRRLDFYKDNDDLLRKKILVYYYSENFGESEILLIENGLLTRVKYLFL